MGNDRGVKAAGLLILAAVILVVGPMLTYVTVSQGDLSESFSAHDADEGSPFILAAVVIGLMALLMFAVKAPGGRKILGGIALLGALFAGYAAIVDLMDIGNFADLGQDVEGSAGIGLWLAILGALLGVVGSIMALTAPAPATTGYPGTNPAGGPPPAGPPASGPPTGGPPPA